jgi:hypothetical protein
VFFAEDDFHLINNTAVRPNGFLIAPYYGRLYPDQIYTVEAPATSRPPSPGAGNLRSPTPPPRDTVGDSVNNVVALGEGVPSHLTTTQVVLPGLTPILEIILTFIIKRSEVLERSNLNSMKMSALRTIIL